MTQVSATAADRVLGAVEASADELVDFAATLVRVPTVNPPGTHYEECARLIGARLDACGFEIEYVHAHGRPEHTAAHPRVNVIGRRRGRTERPLVHVNGHFDVVPPGRGWTVDPFGGVVQQNRIYGRGSCDMKAGLAAAVYAADAIRRAGLELQGTVEISGTVDEESGGFAGMAYLAERKFLAADRTDFVIIPEPLNPDRICVGHRGVYWCEITTEGHIAHGSMPFLGVSAIEHMGVLLDRFRRELVPVVPPGARHATLNINAIEGGQPIDGIQTPCVADRCRMVLDRRFLLEEGFDATRQEIADLLERARQDIPGLRCSLRDLMIVHPTLTPRDSPLIGVLDEAIRSVLGREASLVASPGTYDHKHVDRIAGVKHCVAYGPGLVHLAHQPDEWCGLEDLVNATKVLALSLLRLTRTV
jgi:succinyl-diaminopimelate desuccinylase